MTEYLRAPISSTWSIQVSSALSGLILLLLLLPQKTLSFLLISLFSCKVQGVFQLFVRKIIMGPINEKILKKGPFNLN